MTTGEKKKFADWARKIRVSDEHAFSCLFYEVYPRLVKFVWKYTREKTSAQDIVQEVFIKLWKTRASIDPAKSLLSYMYKMARNHSLNYLRDTGETVISLNEISGDMLKSNEAIAESNDLYDKRALKMLAWIDDLPGRQREAIRLSRFEGLDHEEIASVMQISARTVNNHIVEALKTLRNRSDVNYQNQQKNM